MLRFKVRVKGTTVIRAISFVRKTPSKEEIRISFNGRSFLLPIFSFIFKKSPAFSNPFIIIINDANRIKTSISLFEYSGSLWVASKTRIKSVNVP